MEQEYKGYLLVPAGGFGMKAIKAIGRGSVPAVLRGLYTSASLAMKAIDQVGPADKKVTKDGDAK